MELLQGALMESWWTEGYERLATWKDWQWAGDITWRLHCAAVLEQVSGEQWFSCFSEWGLAVK